MNLLNKCFINTECCIKSDRKTNSVFAFFHYRVPHLPFIYERDQYSPAHKPLLENKISYKRQLQYVDKLFGELIAILKKQVNLNHLKLLFCQIMAIGNI